jgi:nucleoid DNA-binding protein
MAKAAAKKAPTKSEIFNNIAQATGLSKRDVAAVFDSLGSEIQKAIGKRGGPGQFALPGLCKITIVRKPATKARKGINPFTGEETMFKAKPARNVVKVRPLKSLKDMVS